MSSSSSDGNALLIPEGEWPDCFELVKGDSNSNTTKFCCDIQISGSNFDINSMKAWSFAILRRINGQAGAGGVIMQAIFSRHILGLLDLTMPLL